MDSKIKFSFETDASQPLGALGALKAGLLDIGKAAGLSDDELKGLSTQIDAATKESSQLGAEAKHLVDKLMGVGKASDAAGQAQDKAKHHGEGWLKSIGTLGQGLRAWGEIAGRIFEGVERSVKQLADGGDREAAAVLGILEDLKASLAKVIGTLAKDLLPILAPIASGVKSGAEAFSHLVGQGEPVKRAMLAVLDGAIGVIEGLGNLAAATKRMGFDVEATWGKIETAVGLAIDGISLGVSTYLTKIGQFASATIAVLDVAQKLGSGAVSFAPVVGEVDAATAAAAEAKNTFQQWADSLKALRADVASGPKLDSFIKPDTKSSAKAMDDERVNFKSHLDQLLALRENDKQAQLAILQGAIEESMAKGESWNEQTAELWTRRMQMINQIDAEGAKEMEDRQAEAQEAAEAREEEKAKRWLEAQQAAADARAELLDEELANIDRSAGSEEEATERKIAALAHEIQFRGQTAERRKALQKQMDTLVHESAKKEAAEVQALANKVGGAISGMVNGVIFEHKTLRQAVGELIKQLVTEVVTHLTAMAATAIAKAALTAVGVKAASMAQGAAMAATVPAGIASWTAAIPVVGPGVFTSYLATFKGLMAAGQAAMGGAGALGFEEGGSVAGRVPGMGRQDTVPIRANAREAVLNERATEGLGQKVIDALNRNGGRMPEAAAAAPGAPQEILVTVRYEAPQERAFARALMSLITVEVRRFGAELEASHLRRS